MSRKHYIAVAEALRNSAPYEDETTRRNIAIRLAAVFKQDNIRFDRERFLEASGVNAQVTI